MIYAPAPPFSVALLVVPVADPPRGLCFDDTSYRSQCTYLLPQVAWEDRKTTFEEC
jgi:hypothetical protein